ncbi:MAG: hypothetical protein ACYCVV_19995, partial [Acidimicrobiales bacterium]
REVKAASREDGKYVLFCTDERLPANTVVEEYLGKDFVDMELSHPAKQSFASSGTFGCASRSEPLLVEEPVSA